MHRCDLTTQRFFSRTLKNCLRLPMLPKHTYFSSYFHSVCPRLKPLIVQEGLDPLGLKLSKTNRLPGFFPPNFNSLRPKGHLHGESLPPSSLPLTAIISPGREKNDGVFFCKWTLSSVLLHQQDTLSLPKKPYGSNSGRGSVPNRCVLETSCPHASQGWSPSLWPGERQRPGLPEPFKGSRDH